MKLHKEEDVLVTAGGSTTTGGFHVPPRYNAIEFTTQLLAGSDPYDVEVQALEVYPNAAEMYGGPSTLSQAQETDWITIMGAVGISLDHDFPTQPNSYGYYRVTISSAGDSTVRLFSIGIA